MGSCCRYLLTDSTRPRSLSSPIARLTVVVLPFKQRVASRTSPADPAITLGWVKRRRCDHVTIPSMGKKQGKHKQHDADDPAPAGTLQPHTAQRLSR